MTFTLLLGSLSFSFKLPSQFAKGFQLCQSRREAEIWSLWRSHCPEWNLFFTYSHTDWHWLFSFSFLTRSQISTEVGSGSSNVNAWPPCENSIAKGKHLRKMQLRLIGTWENMHKHAAVAEGKVGTSVLPQKFNIMHYGSPGLVPFQAK